MILWVIRELDLTWFDLDYMNDRLNKVPKILQS